MPTLENLTDLRTKAKQGYAEAQYTLGQNLYAGGQCSAPDREEARKWLRKAADQGEIDAQGALGRLYAETAGNAAALDNEEAYFWLSLAAKAGHQESFAAQKEVAKRLSAGQIAALDARTDISPLAPVAASTARPVAPADGANPSVDNILDSIRDIVGPDKELEDILGDIKEIFEEDKEEKDDRDK